MSNMESFADGFSRAELLRRAQVLRSLSYRDQKERRRLERLAMEHEEAARMVRCQKEEFFDVR